LLFIASYINSLINTFQTFKRNFFVVRKTGSFKFMRKVHCDINIPGWGRGRKTGICPSPMDFKYNFENVTINFFQCTFLCLISLCPSLIKFLQAPMGLSCVYVCQIRDRKYCKPIIQTTLNRFPTTAGGGHMPL